MLARMKNRFPEMRRTYQEVRGAIENERRKRSRKENNGSWTQEELDVIQNNIEQRPKKIHEILRSQVVGFRKNANQVRDKKDQMTQKGEKRKRNPSPQRQDE